MARLTQEKVRVYTKLLRTGQVVAAPVFDENGLLLVGEGSEITEKNLQLLRIAEIESVEVENIDVFPWQRYIPPAERVREIKIRSGTRSSRFMDIVARAITDKIAERQKKELSPK